MKIKKGIDIYLEGLDVIEANKKSHYDDRTTRDRTAFNEKRWISFDDVKEMIETTPETMTSSQTVPRFEMRRMANYLLEKLRLKK